MWLVKSKTLYHEHYILLVIIMANKLMSLFMKNNCWRQIQQSFELEKQSRGDRWKTMGNYMPNEKALIIHLIAGLVKKTKNSCYLQYS